MGNDPLEMRAIKEKLAHLEDFLPNAASPVTYEFGRFLADYIHSTLRPEEFVEEYRMAIADLMIGKNGFTGKQIRGTKTNWWMPKKGHHPKATDSFSGFFLSSTTVTIRI